jgi:uncharacterized protein (DUF2126 family)
VLDEEPALDAEAAEEAVRTAMAIEARDGHLCIFLPPVANADDFVALVAAIEQVAAASNRRCTWRATRRRKTRASATSR